jgi:predicted negative regulator of RcsB-dependent stress response
MESNAATPVDVFKIWAWIEAHKKQVSLGAVVALAVGLGAWFYFWKQSEKEVNAGEALARVFVPQATGEGSRSNAAQSYLRVASEYPDSSAAGRAVLLAAGTLYNDGKYSEARAQFEKYRREFRDSRFMSEALLGIAACLDADGKTNEAITAYKDLADHHPGEVVVPQAKFSLARLYVTQGKAEQALPLLEEVARENPYGTLGSQAGMEAEELKMKYPSLAPPPAPPAPSAVATNLAPFTLEKR